jgi:hypothetical protein
VLRLVFGVVRVRLRVLVLGRFLVLVFVVVVAVSVLVRVLDTVGVPVGMLVLLSHDDRFGPRPAAALPGPPHGAAARKHLTRRQARRV